VDADDIQLVDMLADLAEKNEIASNVDDDSVLGSQYSMFNEQIKDPEEEEIEDLNITSFDLDLSSWESMYNQKSNQHDNIIKVVDNKQNIGSADDSNVTEENNGDVTLVNFPQVDGVDDLYEIVSKHEETSNSLSNKDNIACCMAVQWFPKIITKNSRNNCVSVINAKKDYAMYTLYRNFNLIDTIKYININNPNRYHLRKELYNFVNRYYFHIFFKTSKHLRSMNIKHPHTDISFVARKNRYLKDSKKRIAHNKKTEEELYITRWQLQLDHRDLDVYDIDEIETFETMEHVNYITNYEKNKCNCEQEFKSCIQEGLLNSNHCFYHELYDFSVNFTISNVDGATADSSDAESEVDVTIEKQEERVCTYKSDKKSVPQNIVQITPKKRKFDSQDDDHESSKKRRNVTKTPKRKYNSPGKTSRSPQLSGNYSPLNITITSPKSSKDPIRQCESPKRNQYVSIPDIPSTSATPKHKKRPLRVSLLREKFFNSEGNSSRSALIE